MALFEGSVLLCGLIAACAIVGGVFITRVPASATFPKWIAVWLLLSSLICTWDAAFVLLRPWSFDQLAWHPYKEYVQVDHLYGNLQDTFVYSQSLLNIVEVVINLCSLFLLFSRHYRPASVLAMTVCVMTGAKTVLYLTMEVVSGLEATGHNDAVTFAVLYILPNGVWILVPFLCWLSLFKILSVAPGEKCE